MIQIFIIISLFFFYTVGSAQNVVIPDANFKAYLLAHPSINTNNDTEIQISEAANFADTIYCPNMSIADLTGIEAFTSLTVLACVGNQLTSLDVSQNINLEILDCSYNNLMSLDLSQNVALQYLGCIFNDMSSLNFSPNSAVKAIYCSYNELNSLPFNQLPNLEKFNCEVNKFSNLNFSQNLLLEELNCSDNQSLTNIDISNNIGLEYLWCNNTGLNNIDVSNNTNIKSFYCTDNTGLSSLDVSHNTNMITLVCSRNNLNTLIMGSLSPSILGFLDAGGNSDLTCIQVDSVALATAAWHFIDPQTSFNTNCLYTAINKINSAYLWKTYPNPTTGHLTIDLDQNYNKTTIHIRNAIGQTIRTDNYFSERNINFNLDVADGIYFVEIRTNDGKTRSIKLIKNSQK